MTAAHGPTGLSARSSTTVLAGSDSCQRSSIAPSSGRASNRLTRVGVIQSIQPMSANSHVVRSTSDDSEGIRTGSMSRSGSADVSQWATDDPPAYADGEYIIMCPAPSSPLCRAGSRTSVATSPAM